MSGFWRWWNGEWAPLVLGCAFGLLIGLSWGWHG